MPVTEFHPFTIRSDGMLRKLITEVTIESQNHTVKVPALWDTGATGTCISLEVASDLHLIPIGMADIGTGDGDIEAPKYLASKIILPNNVSVENVEVAALKIGSQDIGALIGMDIITMGDFVLSYYDGKTYLSFRIPSLQRVDFVKDWEINHILAMKKAKSANQKLQKHRKK